ncbi:NACHT domain-containing protein [Lentzea sp. NPDC092896]|uniref:NACHT domain-containing protein n=1 Tax=Lentzea sp. NPDC092896 TaxID=3364127 RepID=UPI0037FF6A5B
MSRPALFSYEGALRVLGKYDRPWLDAADTFLGVGILVGGAIEPDVFSLVDPKNEATACLRKIFNGVTNKLTGLAGRSRHDLIAAAHTIIAVTSVFDAYRDELGEDFDKFKITDREKFRIFGTEPPDKKKESAALPVLTSMPVAIPSATRGFYENLNGDLGTFFDQAVLEVHSFINELADVPKRVGELDFASAVNARVRQTYADHYVELGATIPEFQMWAMLGEHAATRAEFNQKLLETKTESLELFSRWLSQVTPAQSSPRPELRELLSKQAKRILSQPLLRGDSDTSTVDAAFPTVENGFVAPSYRFAVYRDGTTFPSSEDWWSRNTKPRDGLDAFLAAHLADEESTKRPLLVLGNPGAGKSLLMEVLAARLPADKFAVVRVQLRTVRAQDRVHEQIATALHETLQKRVDWGEVAAECGPDVTPVILLDGLDELIQISGAHQSTYLRLVQEFQERCGQPTAVVVTSRVLVADRASIPDDVPVVKLEEFDDNRIDRWLEEWNKANSGTARFQQLRRDSLGQHLELARQPLLLLMLAIYAADPETPPLDDEDFSNAELYRRLIDRFVLRQASKSAAPLPKHTVQHLAAKSWLWLGVAAFAMFNRGRQYVTSTELNQDLAAFVPSESTQHTSFDTPVDGADRTVENFFFIHSAKAQGESADRRSYEFLHATFGEFLIADLTMKYLAKLVQVRELAASTYPPMAPPDVPQLYQLLSYQVFATRKPIIEFCQSLFNAFPEDERDELLNVLSDLIRSFHDSAQIDPQPPYRPAHATVVSRLANYSANLVCLRALLAEARSVPTTEVFELDEKPLRQWRSTVNLWKAGVKTDGWDAILDTITLSLTQNNEWDISRLDFAKAAPDLMEARLLGNPALEGMIRTGRNFVSADVTSDDEEQVLLRDFSDWLVSISGPDSTGQLIPYEVNTLIRILSELERGVRLNASARSILINALSREASRLPRHVVKRGVDYLLPRITNNIRISRADGLGIIEMICAHPDLVHDGIIPTEALPSLFQENFVIFPSVVRLWATANSQDSRVDDRFRDFISDAESAAGQHITQADGGYLPVETLKYLASPQKAEPAFNDSLIDDLTTITMSAGNQVTPQTMIKLIERLQPGATKPRIQNFASVYLSSRTVEDTDEELAALSVLRELAGGAPQDD